MAQNRDRYASVDWDAPPSGVATITPADVDLANDLQGIYVGGTGNLALTMVDGSTATLTAVPVGFYLRAQIRRVNAATTATLLVGFT